MRIFDSICNQINFVSPIEAAGYAVICCHFLKMCHYFNIVAFYCHEERFFLNIKISNELPKPFFLVFFLHKIISFSLAIIL